MLSVGSLNLTIGNGRFIVLKDVDGNLIAKVFVNKKFKGNNVPLVVEAPPNIQIERSREDGSRRKEALD